MVHLMFVIESLVELGQTLLVIVVCLPILLVALVPIVVSTILIGSKFLHVSRELKRWESIKHSPVFVMFSESLHGLSTIRAFRQESRFAKLCNARLDELNRCYLYLWLCDGWLSFRIQFLSALITGMTICSLLIVYDGVVWQVLWVLLL